MLEKLDKSLCESTQGEDCKSEPYDDWLTVRLNRVSCSDLLLPYIESDRSDTEDANKESDPAENPPLEYRESEPKEEELGVRL